MVKRREHFRPPEVSGRPGLVRPVRLDPTGAAGPTRKQARGGGWRRASTGLYVPSHVDADDPQQRALEAAAVVPADGALTGWAALAWCQVPYVDGLDTVGRATPATVVTPGNLTRPRDGVEVSNERLLLKERWVYDGVVLTHPLPSVAFEVRRASGLLAAVRWLDLVLASDLVSLEELVAYAARLVGWAGIAHLRVALRYADENVWSPMETELRLIWRVLLGMRHVVCNRPVFDLDGRHIGTPDVLDLECGVVGEYDGSLHLAGTQRAKDLRREAAFRRVGLEYVTMVAADRGDSEDFQQRTQEARARARRTPATARRWTVTPPTWWVPTHTVEHRRALDEVQRARYLRRGA